MNNPTTLSYHLDGNAVKSEIDRLNETPDFALVGNLPDYQHLKERLGSELWNRLEMIRIWENHFIHGIEVEDTLPSFDFGAYAVVPSIMADLENVRDFNRSLWSTELSYLYHINEAAFQPGFRPNCQTSFLYMTYYMKIRQKVKEAGNKKRPVKVAGSTIKPIQNDRGPLQCILDICDRRVNSYGNKIDLGRLMDYIKNRIDSLQLRPSGDRTTFIGNLNALYDSFGHLGMSGLKGPLAIKAPAYTHQFLQWAKNLGDLTGPFEEVEFYELPELKRIEVLLFWSQYLSSDWEKYGLDNATPTNSKRELFGYLETNQLLPSTNYGDILDRLMRLLAPM